jgi:beta-barrel assembly-enhancing protease
LYQEFFACPGLVFESNCCRIKQDSALRNKDVKKRIAILLALAFALACTSPAKKDDTDQLSENDQRILNEYNAELEVGRNMAGRLLQFYGTFNDRSLLQYLNRITTYLGRNSDHPDRRYMVEVIASEEVNAFACPGGYILVTMGALRHAQNEAEIAGVLAHEVAHVGHNHMMDTIKGMSEEELAKAAEAAQKVEEHPAVKARQRPKAEEESAFAKTLAKYLAGGAAGLNIVKAAGAGMNVILEQGLGAEKEYEADAYGVSYAMNGGYHPRALAEFVCRLKGKLSRNGDCRIAGAKKSNQSKSVLDKTHPKVEDRIANIDKKLNELNARRFNGAIAKARYDEATKNLKKSKPKKM